jgi:DNA-binding LacI/PurR family transcriptional regulator
MNIEDIARLAGVSRSTVSRVLNERSDVSERTRQKVMEVIEANRYQPSHAARTLATQRTRVIGVLVPHAATSFFSPYLPTLLQGIGDSTHERDYSTLLWWGQYGEEEERLTRRILDANQLMEGLIVAFHAVDNVLVERIVKTNIPFVMVERPTQFADQISYVTVDNVQGARTAVGHITGHMHNIDGIVRCESYRQTIRDHGLVYEPELIVEGQFDIKSGYQGMKELLKLGVDAVFTGNDNIAAGALHALIEDGIKVPDDIALVGFDDLPPVMDIKPELTTIHQPVREKGAKAAHLLLDMLECRVTEVQHHVLPAPLVIRDSCGAASAERSANRHETQASV